MQNSEKLECNDEIVVPQIKNVMKFRATTRKATLLHFTAEQWESATSQLKELDDFPQEQATLVAVPLPGGSGDMLVAQKGCPPGTIPVMSFTRSRSARSTGLTPNPDDFDVIQSQCIAVPDPPPGGQIPPSACRLVIRVGNQQLRVPVFACERIDCSNCELGWQRQQNGTILLVCQCRR
jgi:hypothetical protein